MSKMTKKDFELIADSFIERREAINDEGEAGNYTASEFKFAHYTLDMHAIELANALATTNERFDRDKFLSACGVELEAKCDHKVYSQCKHWPVQ